MALDENDKHWFAELLAEKLEATQTKLMTALDTRIEATETKLRNQIEALETKLLTAFHGWAHTYEMRARGNSAAARDLDERLGFIEERVSKLERERPRGYGGA